MVRWQARSSCCLAHSGEPFCSSVPTLVAAPSSGSDMWTNRLSNSFGVFQRQYLSDPSLHLGDMSPSAVSWIGSCHLGLTFASSLGSGMLFDRG